MCGGKSKGKSKKGSKGKGKGRKWAVRTTKQ